MVTLGALGVVVMLAAVDRLLRREGPDVGGELGRRAIPKGSHALDEKSLARRQSRGKGVVNGGGRDIPAMPQALLERSAVETAVARSDRQVRWSWEDVGGHERKG